MSTIQGTGGAVTLPTGFMAKLDTWTATFDFSVVDTTGFGDLGYGRGEPTLCSIRGSASGMAVKDASGATPIAPGALASPFGVASCKGNVVLGVIGATHTYSFAAVISNVNISRPEDGKATVSFDFVSNGIIAQAWE